MVHARQKVRVQRRFSINVWADIGWMKEVVYGNLQCLETIEKVQQVEVAAATVRRTPGGFLPVTKVVFRTTICFYNE